MSSLPKFFVGNSFHFWKLPPGFCINNKDNVYYPVYLACYIVRKTGIKYTVICITGIGTLVKIPLKNERFALGKARASVFSFLTYPQPYPLNHPR